MTTDARYTGPRTEAGKASSARNSTKHGLFARRDLILEGEDQECTQTSTALMAEIASPRHPRTDLRHRDHGSQLASPPLRHPRIRTRPLSRPRSRRPNGNPEIYRPGPSPIQQHSPPLPHRTPQTPGRTSHSHPALHPRRNPHRPRRHRHPPGRQGRGPSDPRRQFVL